MSETIARQALDDLTGLRIDTIRKLPSGRSSDAWLASTSAGQWVVRVPIADSGRRITYRTEALIGRHLRQRGHLVADWTVVDVDGVECSVARHLSGAPVALDHTWTDDFGRALAGVLRELHTMPAHGFGPLLDDDTNVLGVSPDRRTGIIDRWFHAAMWPFDALRLSDHPIQRIAPELGERTDQLRSQIEDAASGSIGVVHSDLHREHLLVADDGSLAGLLDFGDAFIGAIAWDFALLNWYYGTKNAASVAAQYPNGNDELERGLLLSVAVGLYKAAKHPSDSTVVPSLRRCLDAVSSSDVEM